MSNTNSNQVSSRKTRTLQIKRIDSTTTELQFYKAEDRHSTKKKIRVSIAAKVAKNVIGNKLVVSTKEKSL